MPSVSRVVFVYDFLTECVGDRYVKIPFTCPYISSLPFTASPVRIIMDLFKRGGESAHFITHRI